MHQNDFQIEPLDLSIRSRAVETRPTDKNSTEQTCDSLGLPFNLLFYNIEAKLCESLLNFPFTSTKYIYNPVEYANEPHVSFLKTYCNGRKNVLFIGMNPGPYGMCQTGVSILQCQ